MFYIIISVCILTLFIRDYYEFLKYRNKINTKNKVVFAIVFIAMGLMLTSWIIMGAYDPFRIILPLYIKWIGIGFLLVGFALVFIAIFKLKGIENIDHLVTNGIFSKIRHPMYTGFILWIIGWAAFHGSWLALVIGIVAIANILWWKKLEEIKLVFEYKEKYIDYRKSTWF